MYYPPPNAGTESVTIHPTMEDPRARMPDPQYSPGHYDVLSPTVDEFGRHDPRYQQDPRRGPDFQARGREGYRRGGEREDVGGRAHDAYRGRSRDRYRDDRQRSRGGSGEHFKRRRS